MIVIACQYDTNNQLLKNADGYYADVEGVRQPVVTRTGFPQSYEVTS